jgi:iron(III) transport system ATP-binding protein
MLVVYIGQIRLGSSKVIMMGCGKTMVLLTIAGLERPASGQVTINQQVVSSGKYFLAPEKRQIGMVFQNFALFSNVSVADNIRFGLKSWSSREQQVRIGELLAMVGMTILSRAYPHQLSGE